MRSVWKSKIISLSFKENKMLIIYNSRQTICHRLLNSRLQMYNGRTVNSMLVRPIMIGKNVTSFIRTKKIGKEIHLKKNKKKKNTFTKLKKK